MYASACTGNDGDLCLCEDAQFQNVGSTLRKSMRQDD